MDINDLYGRAQAGDRNTEEKLFALLTERFRLFVGQKVVDRKDCEEIVQNAVMVVFRKYKQITFEVSFAAWAHKVLNNELLKHYRANGYHRKRFTPMEPIHEAGRGPAPHPGLKMRLIDCLRKLCRNNLRYGRVLNLKYQGYGAEDIMKRLGISRENFYVIVSRARSLLKVCLETGALE